MQIAGEEIERLRRQIMEQIDLTRTVEDEEVYQLIEAQVRDFARERMLTLGEREAVVQTLFYSLRKLDVLQELLEDPTITEIMVNGAEHIFYEKAGRLYKAEYGFSSKEKLNDVIQQMAGYSNRMVNEAPPILDTRLANGSRVHIVPQLTVPVSILCWSRWRSMGRPLRSGSFRKIRSVWRISSGWEASHRKRQIY